MLLGRPDRVEDDEVIERSLPVVEDNGFDRIAVAQLVGAKFKVQSSKWKVQRAKWQGRAQLCTLHFAL
jgi:hypothetical protein